MIKNKLKLWYQKTKIHKMRREESQSNQFGELLKRPIEILIRLAKSNMDVKNLKVTEKRIKIKWVTSGPVKETKENRSIYWKAGKEREIVQKKGLSKGEQKKNIKISFIFLYVKYYNISSILRCTFVHISEIRMYILIDGISTLLLAMQRLWHGCQGQCTHEHQKHQHQNLYNGCWHLRRKSWKQ